MKTIIAKETGLWRGVTIETKEVVEGYYVYDQTRNKHMIYRNEPATHGLAKTALQPYDVIEETLCPCTGKRDRNGNYIFAYDILQETTNINTAAKPETVLWNDKTAQWVISNDYTVWTNSIEINTYRKLDDVNMSKAAVIGNKMEKDWEHVKDEPDAYYIR